MANVWPTPLPALESTSEVVLPLSIIVPPIVPVTWPMNWLRKGLPESYWSIVTLIRVWAGRSHSVVCTHCPVGAWVR